MPILKLNLPHNVDLSEKEALTALAAMLYNIGKLSLGQAAELAGYSKSTFMELLSDYHVSVFNSPIDELENDVANAKASHR